MSSRRVHPAAIAAASDGSVLINVAALLPESVQERLRERLGDQVFVGIALSHRDASLVVERLDNAAAEASARLLGASAQKSGKSRSARPAGVRAKRAGKPVKRR